MPHTKKLVLATMTVIYIIYGFHYLFSRVRRTVAPSIAPYLAASVRTLFLSYTVLATVSIQLIRCVSINGEVRWFYNGNVTCYEWWQYVAFVFNAIFVIPFIFIIIIINNNNNDLIAFPHSGSSMLQVSLIIR